MATGSTLALTTQTETVSSNTQARAPPVLTLHYTADEPASNTRTRPGVRWTPDVVDNEFLDRKKSKVCCIFHPQREFGELSDSLSDLSSDSSLNDEEEKKDDEGHGHCHGHSLRACRRKQKRSKAAPNAYERQPSLPKKNGESNMETSHSVAQ